jgi:hypothetical protein
MLFFSIFRHLFCFCTCSGGQWIWHKICVKQHNKTQSLLCLLCSGSTRRILVGVGLDGPFLHTRSLFAHSQTLFLFLKYDLSLCRWFSFHLWLRHKSSLSESSLFLFLCFVAVTLLLSMHTTFHRNKDELAGRFWAVVTRARMDSFAFVNMDDEIVHLPFVLSGCISPTSYFQIWLAEDEEQTVTT